MALDRFSTVPKVKRDLVTAFNDRLVAEGFAVNRKQAKCHYGIPKPWPNESIVIAGMPSDEEVWASLGARTREESYDLAFYISCLVPGKSQQEATERAFEYLALMGTVLRENPHIGNDNNSLAVELRPERLVELLDPEGYLAEIHGALHVEHARI